MRALKPRVAWLSENESRSREELLRDLKPELRKTGLLPELMGVQDYNRPSFRKSRLDDGPRLPQGRAGL